MLRINQLKLKVTHSEEELKDKILKTLRISESDLKEYFIQKQSLDARNKPDLIYVYTIDVAVTDEKAVLKKLQKKKQDKNIELCTEKTYVFPEMGTGELLHRPVIVGCGPAGLFCAYFLSEYGYRPILIEQGASVEERQMDVEKFWETGILNPDSNVQFGEGGAGTFSDGKLNTLVKDPGNRIHKVLEIFVEHGAPENILYVNKPHIGTDILCNVIRNMRCKILKNGGEVHFHTKMERLVIDQNEQILKGVILRDLNSGEELAIDVDALILAPGHSARDTFRMLYENKIPMEAKSFAVGFRTEHPQEMINQSQYGREYPDILPSAAYKITAKLPNGRGVYSFCMCPGGYVVNASSEEDHLAVNGMSYHARDSKNANSAIIITISPEDYGDGHPLSGIAFQRKMERKAFEAGKGKIPVQRYKDYYREVMDQKREEFMHLEEFEPCMKGKYTFTSLKYILPKELEESLIMGMEEFNKKIPGFASDNVILSAIESRTSSPVRIIRGEAMESVIKGLYPCGEGAGYAGGITSAAVDGMKIAEIIRKKYRSFDKA
ncbi:MAG: FAD-dependent oxidoreductase [bacterium]|nr:FAD-dependent oxidoreductase [bacterium]